MRSRLTWEECQWFAKWASESAADGQIDSIQEAAILWPEARVHIAKMARHFATKQQEADSE